MAISPASVQDADYSPDAVLMRLKNDPEDLWQEYLGEHMEILELGQHLFSFRTVKFLDNQLCAQKTSQSRNPRTAAAVPADSTDAFNTFFATSPLSVAIPNPINNGDRTIYMLRLPRAY